MCLKEKNSMRVDDYLRVIMLFKSFKQILR